MSTEEFISDLNHFLNSRIDRIYNLGLRKLSREYDRSERVAEELVDQLNSELSENGQIKLNRLMDERTHMEVTSNEIFYRHALRDLFKMLSMVFLH